MSLRYTPAQIAQALLPHLTKDGKLTPFDAAGQLFETAELRTNLTPPVRADVLALGKPSSGPPSPLLAFLKPTLTLQGPAGEVKIAPQGEAGEAGLRNLVVGSAVAVGAVFLAGYLVGRAVGGE